MSQRNRSRARRKLELLVASKINSRPSNHGSSDDNRGRRPTYGIRRGAGKPDYFFVQRICLRASSVTAEPSRAVRANVG
jgi:hypothetical protein